MAPAFHRGHVRFLILMRPNRPIAITDDQRPNLEPTSWSIRTHTALRLNLIAALLCGCSAATVSEPLTRQLAGNDPETQLEFWHELAMRPVTSNDEAFHGLLLFMDERDDSPDYPGRVHQLQKRQMLPRGFDQPAEAALQRGTLAVALAGMLKIKGGLTMRLFGPTPRYATRELQYLNLLPPSSPNQTVSGSEFLGVMGRVEDHERVAHPVEAERLRP